MRYEPRVHLRKAGRKSRGACGTNSTRLTDDRAAVTCAGCLRGPRFRVEVCPAPLLECPSPFSPGQRIVHVASA